MRIWVKMLMVNSTSYPPDKANEYQSTSGRAAELKASAAEKRRLYNGYMPICYIINGVLLLHRFIWFLIQLYPNFVCAAPACYLFEINKRYKCDIRAHRQSLIITVGEIFQPARSEKIQQPVTQQLLIDYNVSSIPTCYLNTFTTA